MRRLILIVSVAVAASLCLSATAGAAEPEWHSEQPVAAGIGVPVPLGAVGGMAFWGPNKGVLITAGNGGMPAGVYAYDGSSWYLYSTVCGSHGGGIVISGPDEFWTISDTGEPQEGIRGNGFFEDARTLCHFVDGEVVASYAEPAASGGYSAMDAAACSGPANCWFGGQESEVSLNLDPFHLHWDGSSLTEVPSQTVREPEVATFPGGVIGLAFAGGRLFESANTSPQLREVAATDPRRFLPIEGLGQEGPFVLSSEPLEQELWAGSEKTGAVLRLGLGGFETIHGPSDPFEEFSNRKIAAIGLEPGSGTGWLAGGQINGELRQMTADGTLGPIVHLPQASEELNSKGYITSLDCPAPGQCWAATVTGWLFHLGGPPAEGPNTDPLMHRLITSRPKDASSRSFVEAGLPPDDSGEVEPSREEPVIHEHFPHPRKRPLLVVKVKQSIIHKTILQLAFTLRGKAHVQLLARHHKRVVAKTSRLTLGKGRHRIRLRLEPKRWPTSLDFQVHPVGKRSVK